MSAENQITLVSVNDQNDIQSVNQSNSIPDLFYLSFHGETTLDRRVKQTASIAVPSTFNELKTKIKDQFQLNQDAIILMRFCRDGIELREETYSLLQKDSSPSNIINIHILKDPINDDEHDPNSYRYRNSEWNIVTPDKQTYCIKVCWIWSFLELKIALKQEWSYLSNVNVNDIRLIWGGAEKRNDQMLCRRGPQKGGTLHCILRKA